MAAQFRFTQAHLRSFRDHPRLIGHLIGFKDLSDIHDKWIKDSWTSPVHRGDMCHRGSYKTSAITIVGAIWWLLFHPNDRIEIVRETWSVAVKTLATIKRGIAHPAVTALFEFAHGSTPKAVVNQSDNVTYNFKMTATNEGNLNAAGIDSLATGTHFDKIICDDIMTANDRYSKAKREKTIENIMELITNIVDHGKPVQFVGTPWHKEDGWSFLEKAKIPITRYPVEEVGILTEEDLAKKRLTTTQSLYDANYHLKHTSDDDLLFTDPVYGRWEEGATRVVAHLDAKYKGTDTMALTIASRRPSDGRIQVRAWVFAEHVKTKIIFIRTMCRKYGVKKIYCENNNDQMEYTHEKLAEFQNGMRGLNVTAYHESANKHAKIVSYISEFWHEIVFTDDTDEAYVNQVCDYKEGEEPDDAPDSLASLLRAEFFVNKPKRSAQTLNRLR